MVYERLEPNPLILRSAFGAFPSGVAMIAARIGDEDEGIIVSTFTVGISMDPPLVLFAVQNTSTTWPRLREAPLLGVSVLGESHGTIARQVAGKDRTSRFEGLDLHRADSGSLLVEGAPVWLECSLYDEVPAGDHQVVLLRVDGLAADTDLEPLVFQRSSFRRLREWE